MTKTYIYCEGKADATFLRDVILTLFPDTPWGKNEKKVRISFTSSSASINIIGMGGKDKLKKLKGELEANIKQGNIVLLILDADTENNGGGHKVRKDEIYDTLKEMGLLNDVSVFLFPNDRENGDLETLLLQIVNKDNYDRAKECWDSYISCIGEEKAKVAGFDSQKVRVYNFITLHHGQEKAQEFKRDYTDEELWNLNSPALDALKSFLKAHIKIEEKS